MIFTLTGTTACDCRIQSNIICLKSRFGPSVRPRPKPNSPGPSRRAMDSFCLHTEAGQARVLTPGRGDREATEGRAHVNVCLIILFRRVPPRGAIIDPLLEPASRLILHVWLYVSGPRVNHGAPVGPTQPPGCTGDVCLCRNVNLLGKVPLGASIRLGLIHPSVSPSIHHGSKST